MPREIHDHYFHEAKREGYRSRAAYKLIEIDEKRHLLAAGDRVLDCGAAPGSWMQVAARRVGPRGIVVAIDLRPIDPVRDPNVRILHGDLREIDAAALLGLLERREPDGDARPRFDVILSDMAPDTTGDRTIDHHQSSRLCDAVLDRCHDLLRTGGHVLLKILEGETYPDLLLRARGMFDTVKGFKPKASRGESTEMFVIARGYRGADADATAVTPSDEAPAIELPKGRPSSGWGDSGA